MKKERNAILMLFSRSETLEGIAIESATEKQTETLRNRLREIFRGKQIVNLSQNPNPEEGTLGRMD